MKRLCFAISLIFSSSVLACIGCGQESSFTPRLLVVGLGFVALPLSLIFFVAWKVFRAQKIENSPEEKKGTLKK